MITETIKLWDESSYKDTGNTHFKPTLDTYILGGDKKRGAVLICPGGGYNFTSPREAEPIALQFNAASYDAFVLNYSVNPNLHPKPILDLSKAMNIIRENADKWNIDNNKIAVCGFSAGGHLAASLGVHWDKSYLNGTPKMNKPNALILGYPVITSGDYAHRGSFNCLLGKNPGESVLLDMSLEKHVSSITPPTFLWHTSNDGSVPVENTLLFANALSENKIPFELHIYPDGPHGLSLANEETEENGMGVFPHVATWMQLCIQWLNLLFSL
ncbi:alpha/beta hydrolase [Clostridium akagii]|uniref:alpha/beta hydrolase n=1 Tax=Clostridium akagii TaxID=91623 RepID=UPI00047E1706|nr:alpha/beta hydrolase [Clostridium akagii]